MLEANENGSQYYQYGDLYLTGDKNKARRYALSSFAGGEIGLIAYRLIQGAEILGWDSCNNDESLKKTIESIKSFAEAQAIPVVIPISDLSLDGFLSYNGILKELQSCKFSFLPLVYILPSFLYLRIL